jgi:hypothetical protein
LNESFKDGYLVRGVEIFSIGSTPCVDFYLEREVEEKGNEYAPPRKETR